MRNQHKCIRNEIEIELNRRTRAQAFALASHSVTANCMMILRKMDETMRLSALCNKH